ncbi:unnamed protein product [Calicophoron daubneyi]|uniref:Uncharacterized protein n=1 Tax=Calicophoron daubneyi TaxID=300641 RepID=A0AAV2TR24_CALDB
MQVRSFANERMLDSHAEVGALKHELADLDKKLSEYKAELDRLRYRLLQLEEKNPGRGVISAAQAVTAQSLAVPHPPEPHSVQPPSPKSPQTKPSLARPTPNEPRSTQPLPSTQKSPQLPSKKPLQNVGLEGEVKTQLPNYVETRRISLEQREGIRELRRGNALIRAEIYESL